MLRAALMAAAAPLRRQRRQLPRASAAPPARAALLIVWLRDAKIRASTLPLPAIIAKRRFLLPCLFAIRALRAAPLLHLL